MADTVEMADIRTLDIVKGVRGYSEEALIFDKYVGHKTTSGDTFRWYQQTFGFLSATSPSSTSNVSPLSAPVILEQSFTRQLGSIRKYFASGFISIEDMKSTDVDVAAITLRQITRTLMKDKDTRIWDVITESRSPSAIQTFATTAVGGDQWDAANLAGNPIKDLLYAKELIKVAGFETDDLVVLLSPKDYTSIVNWIYGKGAQAPAIGESIVGTGRITKLLEMDVAVSNQVTADYAAVMVKEAATWYTNMPLTASQEENKGVGTTFKVWHSGECTLDAPKGVVLISDTQS